MYEITTTFTNVNDKTVREIYVLENATSFSDAEHTMYALRSDFPDFDVTAIKRSRVKEILNKRSSQIDLIWQAELMDMFVDEDGNEHPIKYKTLLFAETFDDAKVFVSEYIKQGYNLSLISLKLTNFEDIL